MQILHAGAAPPVNRLIVVTHREKLPFRTREQRQPAVLDGVRVLEFVHQDVAKARPVMVQQSGVVTPHLERTQEQLREIHHPGALAGLFVGLINPDQLAPGRIPIVLDVLRPNALVFLRVDEPQNFARNPAGLVQVERLQHLAQQARLIFGVENLEGLRQTRLAPVLAQQPMRQPVEGPDPERPARDSEQSLDTPAHFRGRLVGERDGKDAVGRCALDLDQPCNPMHQHPSFAATRSRENQRRAERRGHRLPLRVIQPVE